MIERPPSLGVYGPRLRAIPKDIDASSGDDDSGGDGDSEGDSGSLVMYDGSGPLPLYAERWDGWPVEWATPSWGSMVGLGAITQRVSTVFAAIDKNAWALSTMPPYRLRDGQIVDQPAWMVNPQPGVYSGWIEAIRQAVFSLYGAGEVFLWATSWERDGSVRSWVMLDPAWVTVELTGHIRKYRLHGVDVTDEVLHIRYVSWPGEPHGIGPLEAATRSLVGAAALERYQSELASRGGIPWGVITVPGRMTANQANDARAQYVSARLGARGAPAVFSGGATLAPFTVSPKDMALLELRQFDEARLAVLLGCPPSLLGLPSGENSLTYQTQEGLYDSHWRTGLRPVAALLSEAISQWALPSGESMEVDDDEYTRPALKDYAETLAVLVDKKIMTIDEARAALRFNSGRHGGTSLSVGVA